MHIQALMTNMTSAARYIGVLTSSFRLCDGVAAIVRATRVSRMLR
jgi:hypothetical protein